MSTFENDLRLEEIGTGERAGTWGTATNVNLELIANALSYSATGEIIANSSSTVITMQDAVADEARCLYLKLTGGGANQDEVTLAPNTLSKVWMIENTTSRTLTIKQGSANAADKVVILAGQVKIIATDGAGSTGKVHDLMQDLAVPDLFVDDDLTMQSDGAVLGFGENKDVTLTHVHNTGLLLNDAMKVQFRDAAIFIGSSGADVLDIASDGVINLAAANDVVIPVNVGLHFTDVNEKIESNGTDLTINSGAKINLTATSDVHIPVNIGLVFGDGGEHIETNNTNLTITSGGNVVVAATLLDVNGNLDVSGTITLGSGAVINETDLEKLDDITNGTVAANKALVVDSNKKLNELLVDDVTIDGKVITMLGSTSDTVVLTAAANGAFSLVTTDGTAAAANIQITADGTAELAGTTVTLDSSGTIALEATSDVIIPVNVGLHFTDADEKIESDGTDLTINSGADINLTATTDINIPSNVGLTFGVDGEKIEGDGTNLAINSSGDVNITATTVDLDGALEVSGTTAQVGVLTTTAATVFNGGFAANDGSTITTADDTDTLSLISTDAGVSAGPNLRMYRNSGSPAVGDILGVIDFEGRNLGSEDVIYAEIVTQANVVVDGSEDGSYYVNTMVAGALTNRINLIPAVTIFNDEGKNIDFRVESDNTAHLLFVDGGEDVVGIGTPTPVPSNVAYKRAALHIHQEQGGASGSQIHMTNDATGAAAGNGMFIAMWQDDDVYFTNQESDGNIKFATGGNNNVLVLNANGSLSTTTAGSNNLRLGLNAGEAILQNGDFNVVVGDNAGTGITTGDENTFIGYDSGKAVTTSTGNTALGFSSLITNIKGSKSVAIGRAALQVQNPVDGNGAPAAADMHNTAVGYAAGESVTTGVENTLVGGLAGDALTIGFQNVALGYLALSQAVGSCTNVAIGTAALTTANAGNSAVSTNNTAVGHLAGTAVTDGTANTLIGAAAGDALQTGSGNTLLGFNAGGATTGNNNVIVGQAGQVQVGVNDTVAMGDGALQANTESNNNTAIGRSALRVHNIDGDGNNTAVGFEAGILVNSGHSNTFLGSGAGGNVTSGDSNIMIGKDIDAASPGADGQLNIGGMITGTGGAGGPVTIPGDLNVTGVGTLSADSGKLAINSAGSNLVFKVGGTTEINIDGTHIYPQSSGGQDLGSTGNKFKDVHLSGNVIIGTSGKGIDFSTGGGSGANLLDEYEEGTWTPALAYTTPGNSSFGYSTQLGSFTKIGNICYCTTDLRFSAFSKGNASGALHMTGLPFDTANFNNFRRANCIPVFLNWPYATTDGQISVFSTFTNGTAAGSLFTMRSDAADVAINDPDANSMLFATFWYYTA